MASEEKAGRYRIGYGLAPKKVQSFIQPSLLNLARQRGIDLLPIHLHKPLNHQGPFHCIIHKLIDLEWTNQLQEFLSQNPGVIVVDSPGAIERLHNRETMLQVIDELNISYDAISLGVPKQVFVKSPQTLLDCFQSKSMSFPVIAKPLVADGSAHSHEMSLVFNKDGLDGLKLKPPFVLQEFVNHGGVIFKVYVAGKHVQCVKRKSLPDISEEKLGISDNVLSFSQISNLTSQDQTDESVAKLVEAAEFPPLSFVNEVACALRQALRLNLFNFDMIRDDGAGNRYLVIDINYFPGYAKMPNYEKILTDFFLDIMEQKQSDGSSGLV